LWYLPDHLGSVRGIVDSSGQLVDALRYDAFGVLTAESNPSGGEGAAGEGGVYPGLLPRYAGYEWDSALGLYHVGARWHDPSQGRWLSRDPLGFDAGDVNLYRYVFNNAVNVTNPRGEVVVKTRNAGFAYVPDMAPPEAQEQFIAYHGGRAALDRPEAASVRQAAS
jgi:RHS repeat-associated protein